MHEEQGKRTVYLKDPLTGGTALDTYELGERDGKELVNYKYNKGGTTKLSFAVAESAKREP